jgi:hypothetical protein
MVVRGGLNTTYSTSSGAPAVGDLGNHETVGIKQSRESLQEGKFCAAEEHLRSERNLNLKEIKCGIIK